MIKCNIRVLLAKANKKQIDLYKDTGIIPKRIKDLKDNSVVNYTYKELETLCNYFNCTIDDLLIYKDDE